MSTDADTEEARQALIADLALLIAQASLLKAKAEKPGCGAEVLRLWSEGRPAWTLAVSRSAGALAAEEGRRAILDAAARGEAAQAGRPAVAAAALESLPARRAGHPCGKAAAAHDYEP